VEVSLDRWIARLGEELPELMENLVRDDDRVLVICTPAYKERSDRRVGGVGYDEGDLMTGETLCQRKRGRFMAVLRKGDRTASIPSWLSGSRGVDLGRAKYSGSEYRTLVRAPLGRTPQAPRASTPRGYF
jgi:hypothetical protein